MKQFREKILSSGSALNPLLALAELGITPAEIKSFVIASLSPYFRNHEILEEFAIDILAPEVVNLTQVNANSWAKLAFTRIFDLYRRAESADAKASYRLCAESEPSIASSLSSYWSALYLEQPKRHLDLPEFQYEVFRNIGFTIEACLQPLLRDLLAQIRVARGKVVRISDIGLLSLGNLVNELHDTSGCQELLAPSPWGIRLNQWRNMAQHHRTLVQGGIIQGCYGEPPNEREIKLSREELWQVLLRVTGAYNAVRLARKLFFIDNIEKIEPHMLPVEEREEARLFSFVASVATQGFKVDDLVITDEVALASVIDVVETTEKRLIHASQFLFPLWNMTQRSSLEIQYKDRKECLQMTFRTTGEACRRVSSGEIDLKTYLSHVEFIRN